MTTLLRTRQIADANVTLAKIANAAANSKLLGSGDTGSGAAYSEITLGTNLSMSGTTLNATGGGGGTPGGSDTQVQFNDAGSFGGDAGFTYDKTTDTLTIGQIIDSGLTASRAVVSDGSKQLTSSAATATEVGYLSGVTSAIQTQLGAKQATITFGTGVETALGVNIGSAGAPVLNGGALGTPSSGVATNLTGTAASLTAGNVTTNANLTGDVTSVGNATTLTNAPVIAKVLTGYTKGAGTVAATDSILQAIQKLDGNDDAKQATLTDVNFGSFINGLTAKTSAVDADLLNLVDSADSNKEKKITWANIKATLKTYFDTLYPALANINVWTAPQRATVTTLTDAATIALDLSLSNNYQVTLGGNRTLGIPTNIGAAQMGFINVRQDITGSRTLAYGAGGGNWPYQFQGGSAIILSTGKLSFDQISYCVNSYGTATATMTIATPCVVTWTAHGLKSGQRVQFTTSGALPTGVTASTTYWVTVIDANTFNLSTSFANAQAATFVATSGSQSGTHTVVECSISLNLNPNLQ